MWKSLFHVALYVNDIQASLDYYRRLGLEVLFDIDNGDQGEPWNYYLRIAKGQYLELQPVKAPNPHPLPEKAVYRDDQTVWHFSLETDDIERTIADLNEKGIDMWYDPEQTGRVRSIEDVFHGQDGCLVLWLVDPDGNPIEVMEQPENVVTMQKRYDHD